MSTSPSKRKLAVAGLGLILSGCLFTSDDKTAQGGAQDFPNTVALGYAASQHIADNGDWDQFSVIPSILPTFQNADSLIVAPESASVTGLAKSAAAAALSDTVYWDFSDTATRKVVRRIHEQETLLKIKSDTLVYRYDGEGGSAIDIILGSGLLLESKGAVDWKLTDKRQAYRYQNTDSAGGFDRAVFTERQPALAPPGFKLKALVMNPGPDGDFGLTVNAPAAADNRPAYYAFARTRGNGDGSADTLESFDITDADGDGTLWGAGDSGVVDFRQKTPSPASRPNVELIVQKMRAVLFKEEHKTYPISFKETRDEKSGRKVVFTVRGMRDGEDSTFQAGDTVMVGVHVYNPEGARPAEKHSHYKVVLSGQPKKYSENKLLKYTLEAVWLKDSLTATKLVFTPDQPVLSGELSITGDLELNAGLANRHTALAVGRFENKMIDVILTDKDQDDRSRRFHIKWDSNGTPVLQERSD
ncbi:MAG: hypothetical protein ABI036_10870 [Fibrobacteria bacterium]